MKQKQPANQPRRHFLAALLPAATAILGACSSGSSKAKNAITYRMGERATVGHLIYNVTESQWQASLGEGASQRIPEHRFLVVRLSISNSGPERVAVPLLSIYDASGKSYRELDNGEYVDGWLGLLRLVVPPQTLQGSIIFDAPIGAYKLQITDNGEGENEVIAYVDMPLQLETNPVLAEPPATLEKKKR